MSEPNGHGTGTRARPRAPRPHVITQTERLVLDARVADALILVARHAGTRDPERLAWLLDQVVRTITSPEYYRTWIASIEAEGNTWHRGTKP